MFRIVKSETSSLGLNNRQSNIHSGVGLSLGSYELVALAVNIDNLD